jgi:hypothetical protein
VAHAAIAVFDEYITVGPGYAGKVMTVVWDGSPSFSEVYLWQAGVVQRCASELCYHHKLAAPAA